jgi:dihydrofolate synthase/folylpolyglutamate synthase
MKEYAETIRELFDLQKFSIKMGLENITALCDFLGNPQDNYPLIHIAGTNGKGSTARMIQAMLSGHGLRTGLYTSPHLVDFSERITIDEAPVEKEFIVSFWGRIAPLVNELKATFFDTTTALAFAYFSARQVDAAVIETGLGGRLDSTNIVKPAAVVITPVSIDHVQQLGRDLRSIAAEKGAIIKKGSTVFLARQNKKAAEVLHEMAKKAQETCDLSTAIKIRNVIQLPVRTRFDLADRRQRLEIRDIDIGLAGIFQAENAALAYLCARWYLTQAGIAFSGAIMKQALATITWRGRLQRISTAPDIYLDVSHNYGGIKQILSFIEGIGTIKTRHLLFGLLDDKAYRPIIRRLQKRFKNVMLTQPRHERALPAGLLADEFLKYGVRAKPVVSLEDAFRQAVKKLKQQDQLFVIGSHFLIGEILRGLHKNT